MTGDAAPEAAFPSSELWAEAHHLLEFASGAALPDGGFGWLDSRGEPMCQEIRHLYVTCRMTHVFSLAMMLGYPGAAGLADHGLEALRGLFRDPVHGGWFHGLAPDADEPVNRAKMGYSTAFVILAASSACQAGRPGAREILDEALAVFDKRFWEPDHGLMIDEWNRDFTHASPYRGANAVMHGVEALLAAADATGDQLWTTRAHAMSSAMMSRAHEFCWRLPEHYDASWHPDLEHNAENPRDPFKPFGATPGHGFEWARLLLHLEATTDAPELLDHARALFAVSIRDAWAVDHTPGLIYTVDFSGHPLIRQRLHWVLCEAMAAAATLHQRTGHPEYLQWWNTLWSHAKAHHLDYAHGSWHHELDPDQKPAATIRFGKADAYHALQTCLIPLVPIRGSLAYSLQGTSLPPRLAPRVNEPARPGDPRR